MCMGGGGGSSLKVRLKKTMGWFLSHVYIFVEKYYPPKRKIKNGGGGFLPTSMGEQ